MQNNPMPSAYRAVIISRPVDAAHRTAESLRTSGLHTVPIIVSPLLEIVRLECNVAVQDYSGIILTSENGAVSAPEMTRDLTAWCVGVRTAAVAREKGYKVKVADEGAQSLVKLILQEHSGDRLLWLRGRKVSMDIVSELRMEGIRADEQEVYDQRLGRLNGQATTALNSGRCLLPIYSGRTASALSQAAAGMPDLGHLVVCISQRVRKAVKLDWRCIVAGSADAVILKILQQTLSGAAQGDNSSL